MFDGGLFRFLSWEVDEDDFEGFMATHPFIAEDRPMPESMKCPDVIPDWMMDAHA